METIVTTLVWYPHTAAPAHYLLAMVLIDHGQQPKVEEVRIDLDAELYEWVDGRFISMATGAPIAHPAYWWSPLLDLTDAVDATLCEREGA